jgi:hypothetical protein
VEVDTRTAAGAHTQFGDVHGEIPVHALAIDLDTAQVLAQMKYVVVRLQATRLRHNKLRIVTT